MNNDTYDNLDLARSAHADEFSDLDALFSSARDAEGTWVDENFTKVVINSLPAKPHRTKSRSIAFDLIGLMVGIVAAYWFFDLSQLVQNLLAWVPESVSVTVGHVLSLFGGTLVLAWCGWWTAEKAMN